MDYEVAWSGSLEREGKHPGLSRYQGHSALHHAVTREAVRSSELINLKDQHEMTQVAQRERLKRQYFSGKLSDEQKLAQLTRKRELARLRQKRARERNKEYCRARYQRMKQAALLFEASA